MDRREALAALVALPEIGRIMATTVKPSDVIVVFTQESDQRIKDALQLAYRNVWPCKAITLRTVEGQ